MANDEDKIAFLLDLDVAEFTEKGLAAKGVIESIGKKENLTDLLESLTTAAPLLGTLGVAAFAFKKSLDFTVEGEQIQRVNEQFETMSKEAGIAPEKLKEGLEKASGGLISTNDLLKIANQSLVKMGGSTEKLPELLELARKSSQVFGGDAKTNFDLITNAIANGNTKMLAHMGLKVDAIKAEKDFAEANNKTVGELTQAGKQQAILNAVLADGGERFKEVSLNAHSATSMIQEISTTMNELKETFIVVFEKSLGPTVRNFVSGVRDMSKDLKTLFTDYWGTGAEQAAAKTERLEKQLLELKGSLLEVSTTKGGFFSDLFKGAPEDQAKALKLQIQSVEAELIGLQSQKKKASAEDEADMAKQGVNAAALAKSKAFDLEKGKKEQLAFRKELEKIDKDYYVEQQKGVKDFSKIDDLVKKQIEANTLAHKSKLEAIEANTNITRTQRGLLTVAENKRFEQQMENQEEESIKLRIKLLDNYAKSSKTVFGGIEASFKANTQKMKMEQADMGKRGNEMWNSLSSNATSAFTNMGTEMAKGKDIASATADAMKGFFLGFLGDRATAEGTVMLLSGIWPPNPVALAGGAALLALGGALKSAAGAGSAPSTAVSAPSPQAIASGAAAPLVPISGGASESAQTPAPATQDQQTSQRTVSVNIAGNYLETDQTKRMLMDLMRQESDATSFNYNQIGA